MTNAAQAAAQAIVSVPLKNELQPRVEREIGHLISTYAGKNKRKKRWSMLYRVLAIIFSTLSVLIPVLSQALPGAWEQPLIRWGYVCAVLAVFYLTIDRQFNFTSSWVRTLRAERRLETILAAFRSNWTQLALTEPSVADTMFAQCARDALLEARAVVEGETETWATETLANFNQLEKAVAAGAEESRKRYESAIERLQAGAMQITLKNPPQGPWRCKIFINGSLRKQDWSAPTCGIPDVAPGNVELLVELETNSREKWIASQAVPVVSGPPTTVPVELYRTA